MYAAACTSEPASHVLGKLVQVALGQVPSSSPRRRGLAHARRPGIRDYMHVWDLARAHWNAVERFDQVIAEASEEGDSQYCVINLGTGKESVNVRELVAAFEKAYGQRVPVSIQPPRPGDVAGAYANADKAARLLGWKAELPITQGISDALSGARCGRASFIGSSENTQPCRKRQGAFFIY